MALTLKTNGNFDTIAAAVPVPYGPLTRVGSMPDLNYNSNQPIEVTSVLTKTLYISYDDMVDVSVRDKILAEAHSTGGVVHAGYLLHQLVNVLKVYLDTADNAGWYTDAEFAGAIKILRYFHPIFALLPIDAYLEYDGTPVVASFTSDDTALVVDFTNTSTGEADYYLWNFGDNATSMTPGFAPSPVQHTYSGAGTYTVTLTAVGPGGIKSVSAAVTVA